MSLFASLLRNLYLFFRCLFHLIKHKPGASGLVFILVISIFLPLRCPTGRGYHYLTVSEIAEDLRTCQITRRDQKDLQMCPKTLSSLELFKPVKREVNLTALSTMANDLNIHPGGQWYPLHCAAWQRVAVIVPYRNRQMHLYRFLQEIHPFLQSQFLDYGIFVVEQNEKHEFNRGKLFNIGFTEASKIADFCCFIFHDVDLLPESPQHFYACSQQPRHMCSALDSFRYVLPYPDLFGGVVAFTKEQFELVNGYSNLYFGWGGEDDDLCERLFLKKLKIRRWDPQISRYTMLVHKKASPNPERHKLLQNSKERMSVDGLNSLKYKILNFELRPLYTWLVVDVNP